MTMQLSLPPFDPEGEMEGPPLDGPRISIYLNRAGLLETVQQALAEQHLIHQTLEREKITVESAEIEMEVIQWRLHHQLTEPEAFEDWLDAAGLDRPALRASLAHALRVEKLKESLFSPHLSQAYISRKLLIDQVVISRILVSTQLQAEELWSQLVEDDRPFPEVAATHSLLADSSPISCSRGKLPLAFRAALDAAKPGQILAPLSLEGLWYLVKLEAVHSPSFIEARPQLLQALFTEWLQAHQVPLTEPFGGGNHADL